MNENMLKKMGKAFFNKAWSMDAITMEHARNVWGGATHIHKPVVASCFVDPAGWCECTSWKYMPFEVNYGNGVTHHYNGAKPK